MHNEHVILYYCFVHWWSLQCGRPMRATFYAQWAQDEREKQNANTPDRPCASEDHDCRGIPWGTRSTDW